MRKPSSASIARITWHVLRAGLYVALAGTVVFFALTRTEVGRNEIRQQLQSAFNEQFEGSLQIGSLTGTLLYDLHASDVRLRDETGRLVATIDSVATSPHWRALLSANLSVSDITLIRPHLALHRYSDGTWNVQRALSRSSSPSSTNRSLDVTAPNVTIQDGLVTTSRDGAPPEAVTNRWLFDYTRSRLDSLHTKATIEWNRSSPHIEVAALHFRLPENNLRLASTQGRFTKRGNRWHLEDFALQLGNTQLNVEGMLQPSPRRPLYSSIDLQLGESRIDYDEIRRLVPRLPLRNEVTVDGRVGGSLDRFVVNRLTVAHDRSAVTVEGTAFGLPDSLDLDAQLLQSTVRPEDVRTVWPEAPLDRVGAVGPIQLGGTVGGLVEWHDRSHTTFDLDGTLAALGAPGAVRGSLDVARTATQPLRYAGSLRLDSLNLAPLTQNPRLDSRLTGQLRVQGSGTKLSTLQSTVDASLSDSRLGPRRVSAGNVQLQIEQRYVQGTASVQQPAGGRLALRGTFDASEPTPLYNLTASATDVNLAGVSPSLPTTQFNATLSTQGRGRSWDALAGTIRLAVDTSTVQRGDSTTVLPPHRVMLGLAERSSSQPRLRVDGTLASAQIEGDLLHPVLRTSSRLWTSTVRRAVQRELARAARRASSDTSAVAEALPSRLRTRAEAAMAATNQNAPVDLQAKLSVHRMDLLRKWWPDAPSQADQLRATSALSMSPDTLALSGSVRSAHLQLGTSRLDSLATSFSLSGPLRSNTLDSLHTHLSVAADTLQIGDRKLIGPSADLQIARRRGMLRARAEGLGPMGPFRLASDVTIQDAPSFRITDLYAGAGQHAWVNQSAGTVSIYTDALVVDSLNLESARPLTESTQRIRLHGTVSSAAADTLHANFTDVLLYPVGQLASLSRPLGGRLNGQVALTGGWEQPQVRSAFRVDRLTFDRRVLGDLRVRSQLMPDAPDLLVDAALTPGPSSLDSLLGPNLVPDGPRTIEENRLQMEGKIRLPGWAEATAPVSDVQPDQLDLTVDVERADLFFFKYIFDENLAKVRGYTTGTIHVDGRFRRPIFEADMGIQNGYFTLPEFGLSYTANGPVSVDRRGIHLQGLNVEDGRGSASLNGSVLFNDYRFFSFDLSAELDELQIVNVTDAEDLAFYGQIRASGSASLTGPLQNTTLRSVNARTTPDSELFIPVSEGGVDDDTGFIVFADSTGRIPDLRDLTRRDNIFSDRPAGEPSFLEGMEIDINVLAPEESTVNLVFDPVVGDVVTAVGSGRIQLQRQEGEFFVYGDFNVSGGNYLFTAGEVFVRRFNINSGTLTWDGPPTNAQLDLEAEYRTRASRAGLPGYDRNAGRIPVRVLLDISGRVETPQVDLSLGLVRDQRDNLVGSQALDALLNQADRTTEYATSVLLTNTFLLTTESFTDGQTTGPDGSTSGSLNTAGQQLAFNSVSQLVASQLNRYLGAALPNVDLNFGVQGEDPNDLDLIYGVALRLLNERLVIRGEGVYTGNDQSQQQAQGPQGEFVVEVRLSNRVSAEAFYRRTGDELTGGQTLTSSTGAGLSYQTEFSTWRQLFGRVFGWLLPDPPAEEEETDDPSTDPVARRDDGPSNESGTQNEDSGAND